VGLPGRRDNALIICYSVQLHVLVTPLIRGVQLVLL